MSPKPKSDEGVLFKWLVYVIVPLLGAGGGIVALLVYLRPPSPQPVVKPPVGHHAGRPTAEKQPFFIAGRVFDEENNQPLPNVKIGYVGSAQGPEDQMSHLATTGPDGSFEADCSPIKAGDFPLRIQLRRNGWPVAVNTDEYIERGISKKSINVYVRDSWLKSPAIDARVLERYRPMIRPDIIRPRPLANPP